MFLKIMSGEDAPDRDARKRFQLLDHVSSAKFVRNGERTASVEVLFEDGEQETFECEGNAYLMNNNGETVAHFGSAPLSSARA